MQLLAQMGGPPPGSTDSPWCCFVLLLPLVIVLALLAANRNAAWPAVVALALVGLSFLALWDEVAGYQPSDGWAEGDKRDARREIGWLLVLPLAVAAFALCWVGSVRRLGPPREPAPENSGAPPTSPD